MTTSWHQSFVDQTLAEAGLLMVASPFRAVGTGIDACMSTNVALRESIADAASAVDTNPSEAQKSTGNYRKGHVTIQGLPITIESPAGSTRSGVDGSGKPWSITMANHYGYIKRTESEADGDHIDVFVGDDPESEIVFVVDQMKGPVGAGAHFDEHKCMLGFVSTADAKAGYLANYASGWNRMGGIRALTMGDFKRWVESGETGERITDASLAMLAFQESNIKRGQPANAGQFADKPGGNTNGHDSGKISQPTEQAQGSNHAPNVAGNGSGTNRQGPGSDSPITEDLAEGETKRQGILKKYGAKMSHAVDTVPIVGFIKTKMQAAMGAIHAAAARRYGPRTAAAIMASGTVIDLALMGGGIAIAGIPVVTGFNQLIGIIPAFVLAEGKHQVQRLTRVALSLDDFGIAVEDLDGIQWDDGDGQPVDAAFANRWITIGGKPGPDGQKHVGGFHVEIDDAGTIQKGGPRGLKGKKVGEVKEYFDKWLAGGKKAAGKEPPAAEPAAAAEPPSKKQEPPAANSQDDDQSRDFFGVKERQQTLYQEGMNQVGGVGGKWVGDLPQAAAKPLYESAAGGGKISEKTIDKPATVSDTGTGGKKNKQQPAGAKTMTVDVPYLQANTGPQAPTADPLALTTHPVSGRLVESALDAVTKAQAAGTNPFLSPTIPQVVAAIRKDNPTASTRDAQAALVKLAAGGKISLEPWTQGLATLPAGEVASVVPLDRDAKYYVRIGAGGGK